MTAPGWGLLYGYPHQRDLGNVHVIDSFCTLRGGTYNFERYLQENDRSNYINMYVFISHLIVMHGLRGSRDEGVVRK